MFNNIITRIDLFVHLFTDDNGLFFLKVSSCRDLGLILTVAWLARTGLAWPDKLARAGLACPGELASRRRSKGSSAKMIILSS